MARVWIFISFSQNRIGETQKIPKYSIPEMPNPYLGINSSVSKETSKLLEDIQVGLEEGVRTVDPKTVKNKVNKGSFCRSKVDEDNMNIFFFNGQNQFLFYFLQSHGFQQAYYSAGE